MSKKNILSEKVLLLCKKSSYDLYFLKYKDSLKIGISSLKKEEAAFKKAHKEHYQSLSIVENTLKKYSIDYDKRFRGRPIDYTKYKIIITLGGDGTFLEASKSIRTQILIGVNSAPSTSIGRLCSCNSALDLDKLLSQMHKDCVQYKFVSRLKLKTTLSEEEYNVLNDLLICHRNPAAMSRYSLKIGTIEEDQRSSGIWISTSMGSSGAIYSAGGKKIGSSEKTFQYLARELYIKKNEKYKLKTGFLEEKDKIIIKSLMRDGRIFIDGAHSSISFPFGSTATITTSSSPIRTVAL